ncbi:MAG: hypothetical protein MI923_30675 [Phycisphaerales bacterium]|nr:hypothetical protein [Phycisphaerales bacterium]
MMKNGSANRRKFYWCMCTLVCASVLGMVIATTADARPEEAGNVACFCSIQDVDGNVVSDAIVSYRGSKGETFRAIPKADGSCYFKDVSGKVAFDIETSVKGFTSLTVHADLPAGDPGNTLSIRFNQDGTVSVDTTPLPDFARTSPASERFSGVSSAPPSGKGPTPVGPACAAGGTGDECTDPLVATDGSQLGSTLDNTGGADDSSCSLGDTVDEWWCYTATCDGTATASTCNAGTDALFDTSLTVYSACPTMQGEFELACSDDDPSCGVATQSTAMWPVATGVTYFIRVAGFSGGQGDYELTLSCQAGPGGACPGAGDGDECTAPIVVGDGTVAGDLGDNTGSTGDDSSCAAGDGDTIDEWYCYTAPCDGVVTITTCSAATIFDTVLSVFDACGGMEIACNDDTAGVNVDCELGGVNRKSTVQFAGTAGMTYFARVSVFGDDFMGFGGTGTTYEISFDCNDAGNPACTATAGDCCAGNGTPGCDDVDCCNTICLCDPFCCDTEWDDLCAGQGNMGNGCGAQVLCPACAPEPPPNDNCADAEVIACNGSATVDNTGATSEVGDPDYSCIFMGPGPGTGSVWYQFVATDTEAEITTENSTGAGDTVIAVYSVDPLDPCNTLVEICCNDDISGTNLLSKVCCTGLTIGNTYYIQVASFNLAGTGEITLNVNCPCPVGCVLPCPPGGTTEPEPCGDSVNDGCNGTPVVASDCCVANGTPGCDDLDCETIVCGLDPFCCDTSWDGTCAGIAADNCAALCGDISFPTTPIACGETVCGTSWADGGTRDTDWYLLTLTEQSIVTWTLSAQFPGFIAILTDNCPVTAADILVQGNTPDDCSENAVVSLCLEAGSYHLFVGIGDAGGAIFEGFPCDSNFNDYVATVTCEPCTIPTGACCQPASVCVPDLTEDACFAAGGLQWSEGVACAPGLCESPANDLCDDAIPVGALPATVMGNTELASVDTNAPSPCGAFTDVEVGGVWYSVTGNGNNLTATTCNPGTNYDTKISVYCSSCDNLTCVDGNDDQAGATDPACVVPETGSTANRASTITWCSQSGAEYLILVHGFDGPAPTGDFEMTITDEGTSCKADVGCLPVGACCRATGGCVIDTEIGCTSAGGEYLGNGTNCEAVGGVATVLDSGPLNVAMGDLDDDPLGPFLVTDTITVPDVGNVGDVNIGVVMTHTFVGDLKISIEHLGTTVVLIEQPGDPTDQTGPFTDFGCGEDDYDVVLDDEGAGGTIEDLCQVGMTSPPNYTPNGSLSDFDGMPTAGDWTITVEDVEGVGTDVGTFVSWSIEISEPGEAPCPAGGACCLPNGDCVIDTQANCNANGGEYLGDDSPCELSGGSATVLDSGALDLPLGDSDNIPPDSGMPVLTNTITSPDLGPVGDVNVGVELLHTFVGDVIISIEHLGTSVDLVVHPGDAADLPGSPFGCGEDNYDIVLDDQGAGGAIEDLCQVGMTSPPNFVPNNPLSVFNGMPSAGDWTITVTDDEPAGGDVGTFVSWSLEISQPGESPCEPVIPCEVTNCPPGSIPIVDDQGTFSGWCVSSSAPGNNVSIVVDLVDLDNSVAVIEISKEFVDGPSFGVLPPVLLDFNQVCSDGDTVSMIVIADEVINNFTGEDWTDFKFIVLDDICAWFVVDQSGGFDVSPFGQKTFSDFIDAPTNNRSQLLTADFGLIPNGGTWFPGAGAGDLKIGVNLDDTDPLSFTLKEQPSFGNLIGGCWLCDGTCEILSQGDCDAAGGFYLGDFEECPPDGCARYVMDNHPDGNQAPPLYGLRLDGLDGNGVVTFSLAEADGALMMMDICNDGTIHIFGDAVGVSGVGGTWAVDFTYTTPYGLAPSPDEAGYPDIQVTECPITGSGTITSPLNEVFALEGYCGSHPFAFQFGDEDGSGHRGFDGLSGWGWLNHSGEPHVNSSDWIFTAVLKHPPELCPTGACCFADANFTCAVTGEAECDALGGTYQGDGAGCDPNPCIPTGACCFSDGSCSVESEADCNTAGGAYQGNDTSCDPNPCPQPGDVCADPITAVNGVNMGNNSDSEMDDPDPSCTGSGSDDIWWVYTATDTGSLLIDTCGTFLDVDGVDTILAVYDACGGNELDCDDDCRSASADPQAACRDEAQSGTATRDSCVCIDVTAGEQVWIQVQGFLGDVGAITLNITPLGCPPETEACCFNDGSCQDLTEDDCIAAGGNAQGLGTDCGTLDPPCPVVPDNDTCATATEVFNGTNMSSNFGSANDDPDPSCTSAGENDVWFFYTATDTGGLLIDTCGTALGADSVDTIMAAYASCGGEELDCDDDCTSAGDDPPAVCLDEDQDPGFLTTLDSCLCIDVTAGETVWIQVQSFSGDGGAITLNITPLGCVAPVAPLNDVCTTCTVIGDGDLPFSDALSTVLADGSAPEGDCNSSFATEMAKDIWYCYTPSADCTVTMTSTYSYDGLTAIYSGPDCDNLTELDCLDTALDTTSFAATAGTTYWFQVGDWGSDSGVGGATTFELDCGAPSAQSSPDTARPEIDLRPGLSPNLVFATSNGVVPLAIMGGENFITENVDISTIQLSRVDGQGRPVTAYAGTAGPQSYLTFGQSGYQDLMVYFATRDLVDALKLEGLPVGTTIDVVVTGDRVLNPPGQTIHIPFKAVDTIEIAFVPDKTHRFINITSNQTGEVWVDSDTIDAHGDTGGFVDFLRCFTHETDIVRLTAPEPPSSGPATFLGTGLNPAGTQNQVQLPFNSVRWVVNGVQQPAGQRTIEVSLNDGGGMVELEVQYFHSSQPQEPPAQPGSNGKLPLTPSTSTGSIGAASSATVAPMQELPSQAGAVLEE